MQSQTVTRRPAGDPSALPRGLQQGSREKHSHRHSVSVPRKPPETRFLCLPDGLPRGCAEMCQRTGLEPTEALPYPRSWRALRPACRSPQGLPSTPAAHLNIIPWPAMPMVSTLIISDHCYPLLLCPHGPPRHTSVLWPNTVPLYELSLLWLDSPLCPVPPTPTTSSPSLSPWP